MCTIDKVLDSSVADTWLRLSEAAGDGMRSVADADQGDSVFRPG